MKRCIFAGNMEAMKVHWPQTKRFVDFLMSKPPGIEGGLGDWMPVEVRVRKTVVFFLCNDLLVENYHLLWTNTQGTGQLLKRGPIFAQRSTPAMTGHAFVRETCLLAANISAIIGEPSSEQKRYTDYAEGTLANFTKEFLNTSAGIYAAPGAENGRNAFHSIPFSMGKRSFAETGSERT